MGRVDVLECVEHICKGNFYMFFYRLRHFSRQVKLCFFKAFTVGFQCGACVEGAGMPVEKGRAKRSDFGK
jgi:hypothetical protein